MVGGTKSRNNKDSVCSINSSSIDAQGVIAIILILIAVIAYVYMYNYSYASNAIVKGEGFDNMDKWNVKKSPLNLPGGTTKSWNTLTSGSGWAGMYDGIYDGTLTDGTIPADTRDELNKILAKILEQVNEQTGAKYILRKMDRINVQCLSKGNVGCEQKFRATGEYVLGARYTIDFFAHEATDQETRRFIVIFVVNTENKVQVEHLNLANAFSHNPVFRDMGTQNVGATGKPYWKDLILTDDALTNSNGNNQTGTNDGVGLSIAPFVADGAEWLAPRSPHEFSQKFLPRQGFQQPELDTVVGRDRYFPNRRHSKWWDPLGVFYSDALKSDVDRSNVSISKYGLDHAVNRNVEIARANGLDPSKEQIRSVYDNPTVNRMGSNANINRYHEPSFSIMNKGGGRSAPSF